MRNKIGYKRSYFTIILMLVICGYCIVINNLNVHAATTSKKNINVEIEKVNKKYIKIKLTNNGDEDLYYWRGFELKKKKGKAWKKINYKKPFKFPKTSVLKVNETKTYKIKWKKYYGKKLSKGKYKIRLVKTRKFSIKK